MDELNEYMEEIDQNYNEYEEDKRIIRNLKKNYDLKNVDEDVIRNMKEFKFPKRFGELTRYIDGKNCENMLEITPETFSRYKNGSLFPRDNMLKRLAKKLNVSVKYLLGETDITTSKAEEINRITGLSEKAQKVLFMLNHNIGECDELTDKVPISDINKNKLNVFNSLIEDHINFTNFLSRLEQYSKFKNKLKNVKKDDEENKKEINLQLLAIKGELISILLDNLKNIK